MDFYFDIEFIQELQGNSNNSNILLDFVRFIKQLNGTNIYVFVNPEEVTIEMFAQNVFLIYLNESRPLKIIKHSELKCILNDETTNGFKCFFLNSFSAHDVRNDFGYFALNTNEVLENVELFNSGRQDLKKITSDLQGENYLNSWKILQKFKFPINSLVVNDRYFLNKTDAIDLNFLSILDNIGLQPLKKRKIDICIITEEILNMARREDLSPIMNSKFKKVFDIITSHLDIILGRTNYNITILRADKMTNPSASKLHYRILFTNFLVINSEPSFSFFERKNDGTIFARVNEDVSFDFVLWQRSRVSLELKIVTIKQAFTNILDQTSQSPKKRVFSTNRTCRLLLS